MADDGDIVDSEDAGVADIPDIAGTTDQSTELAGLLDGLGPRLTNLTSIANAFARAMTSAFARSSSSGKSFDNVLKSLALRISGMAVSAALRPLMSGLFGGDQQSGGLFGGLFGGDGGGGGGGSSDFAAAMGAIKPFAGGGVIGTPTYFPLNSGGLGLAGEAGPEAILPLARGSDGRLGVASGARSAGPNITVQIMTPDAESFRRSEIYVTGQIARAVARGQRSM